jgi:hypothetical protein
METTHTITDNDFLVISQLMFHAEHLAGRGYVGDVKREVQEQQVLDLVREVRDICKRVMRAEA